MLLNLTSAGFFVTGLLLTYVLWLRPLLRTRPSLAYYYDREESTLAAISAKLTTLKTKLLAGLLMVGSLLIELHDFVLPSVSGIDWTPITSKFPAWVWPIATFGMAALFYWLRKITAKPVVYSLEPQPQPLLSDDGR